MADNITPENPIGKNITDNDGNEISRLEKWMAGIVLMLFTVISALGIIAYWPDRLPDPSQKIASLYEHKLFHICLVRIPDSICCPDSVNIPISTYKDSNIPQPATKQLRDSLDSLITISPADSLPNKKVTVLSARAEAKELIHLNTLLLLLVAFGGFLGNMIHVSTSFTTFIGAGKFKRSWLLWYWVKPFTASALAIGIYFIFRAGFLNMSDGGQSINLYGLMTVSIMAGLFTDKATEKLKEIFEVIFKSKEVRPDPLVDPFKITGITPSIIERGKENKLTLAGENLDKQKLLITINDEKMANLLITSTTITIAYTIPESQKDKTKFRVSVKDEKGKEYFAAELEVKGTSPEPGRVEDDNADTETAVG
ncbi:MAG TPA: IPT/TIG domain-containing protein [Chitinophagaceae bacterium]